jgi:sporulation protein YlmC with PRC-barrel domain
MKISRVVLGLLAGLSMTIATGAFAQQQPAGQTSQGPVATPSSASPAAPAQAPQSPPSTVQGVLLATDSLLGTNVRNPEGKEIGQMKQLMIDPRTGRVMYAIVAMGGFLGMGEKTVVVPWNAVAVTREGSALVLSLPQQVLQQTAQVTASPELSYTSSELRGSGGWGVDGPYGRLYNPAQEQTISGQLLRVETAAPAPDMAPGMQMMVQTDDGKTTRVLVGPEWYLLRQDVEIQENSRIQVLGAVAELNSQPVFVAREVQIGGQTLVLRDAQGTPMWSSLRRSASTQ